MAAFRRGPVRRHVLLVVLLVALVAAPPVQALGTAPAAPAGGQATSTVLRPSSVQASPDAALHRPRSGVGGGPQSAASATEEQCQIFKTETRIAHDGSTAGVLSPQHDDDVLVLLGGFADTEPTFNASDFEREWFGTGPGDAAGPGTLRDYYVETTDGMIRPDSGPAGVSGWYETDMQSDEVKEDISNFWDAVGGDFTPNDDWQFARKVINKADEDVDFSAYDDNGDGCVGVLIVYQNVTMRAFADTPWGDFFADGDFTVDVDGVTVGGYARLQEVQTVNGNNTVNTIGTPAHELAHLYGLPDLYQENGTNGIGQWGMMATGNGGSRPGDPAGSSPTHFSAWAKLELHTTPATNDRDRYWYRTIIDGSGQPGILPPTANRTNFYRINAGNGSGCADCGEQYYLLAYRKQTGFDAGLAAKGSDPLRISRIYPWNGTLAHNQFEMVAGVNRLGAYGNQSFNASTEQLARNPDGSDTGVDLRNFTTEHGAATFNDPPERHLDAGEKAVYAVAVATTLPDGTDVGDQWQIDNRVAFNDTGGMSLELEGATIPTRHFDSASGKRFVHVKISPEGLDDGVVEEGAKLVQTANRSIDYVSATTYPTFPLPSQMTVEVTDPWMDYEDHNGTVTAEVNVTAGGENYTYGMFDAPDASHFTVEVGGVEVPTANVTVTEHAEHRYTVEAAVPDENVEDYNLSIAFTDEKAGVEHTVVAGGNVLTPVLDTMEGTGIPLDPYEVTNVTQLQAMNADRDAHYELANDVDASGTADWFDGRGFLPVGNGTVGGLPFVDSFNVGRAGAFNGSLDGWRNNITNLTIDRPGEKAVGLFGALGVEGSVERLELHDVAVTGDSSTGAVAGRSAGSVAQVTAEGVDVRGAGWTGGLVGANSGTIEDSSAAGAVVGDGDTGGLVGINAGTPGETAITRSYAAVHVTGGYSTGGLVGDLSQGNVTETYAIGDVEGREIVGGLVGYNNDGVVEQAYARGDVHAEERAGGLVGEHQDHASTPGGGIIDETYATGRVTSAVAGPNGGLVATRTISEIRNSYWDANATEQERALGQATEDMLYFAGKRSTAEMQGAAARSNMTDFDFQTTWETVEDPDDYPQFHWAPDVEIPDSPPRAWLVANVTDAAVSGTPVSFNASLSTDPGGSVVAYHWRFGDGETATGPTVTHTFEEARDYTVELIVEDDSGYTDRDARTVTVEEQALDGGFDPDLVVAPFSDTATPGTVQPASLAGSVRVESTAALGTSVILGENTSTSYALSVLSSVSLSNDTMYVHRETVNSTLDGDNVTLTVNGEPHPYTVVEDAGPNESSWFAFRLRDGSSAVVAFAPDNDTDAPDDGTDPPDNGTDDPDPGPPALSPTADPPTDPDGDGVHEDVNGNGRVDFADVVLLFERLESADVQAEPAAFDLNGNGRVDFADVVALFDEQ